jgi:uncharacterized repeat protein (TIGR01451 family)
MKKIFPLLLILLSFLSSKAQYEIPDTNFRNQLSCVFDGILDTICVLQYTSILEVNNRNISSLEGLKYFKNITALECSNNKLTSLPELPPKLTQLNCSNNQLTYLPELPSSIEFLECENNLLTTLPKLPNIISTLKVNDNPLYCFTNFPENFSLLYIKNTFIECWPSNMAGCEFCDTILPTCENQAQICSNSSKAYGVVYVDVNKNGKKDIDEKLISSILVKSFPNNYVSTSNEKGGYLAVLETNVSNTWKVISEYPYGVFVPANYSSTPATAGTDSISYDFGLQLRPNIPDLEVSVASGPARPGFVNNFTATIHNRGTINQTGITLKIKKPSELSFVSAEPAPNSSFGDTIVWNNLSLDIFTFKSFNVQFQVTATADLLGTPLNYKAIVSPFSIDSTPANNIAPWTEIVTGSYDPNDKLVNSQNLSPSYTSKDKLLYTIRFQNTGTDTAFTVIVRDELPNNLDASSVRMVNSSHPCAFIAREKNILEFVFSNILLVDSATNEPKSHGFVQLEVKPIKGLVIDDSIKNSASIFFDYNEPIITPNALTVVKEITTGIASNKNLLFSIYPNPSKSNFIVAMPNEEGPAVWMLTDISGRTVKNGMVNNIGKTLEISVADVSSGTYIFSLQMNGEVSSAKVVVVK